MDDWDDFRDFVEMRYDSMAFSDYSGFLTWLEGFCERSEKDFSDWAERFPDPGIQVIPSELIEGEEEGELWYPPDTGPLADYEDHGWMDDQDMESYRTDPLYKMVRGNQSIKEPEVLDDILENTLHILGRCNQPDDWGEEDRRGLVYGMIQSGKTASMINLITSGIKSGYRVFIVLSGDKDSLRIQTQDRVNSSFNLVNGANQHYKIHSPTHDGDFQDKDAMSHNSAFQCGRRLRYGEDYSTIFVIKKNTHVIPKLTACIESLRSWCEDQSQRGFDLSEDYKCMIIDDEADYASQDTDSENDGSAIHNHITDLRLIDGFRNCYIAYTATPQACLSSSPEDVIGYPRDFFWVLEPYMDQVGEEGEYKPRSYLGAYELFNDFDYYLVKDIEDDEWPHHQRGMDGRYLGLWVPPMEEGGTGEARRNESLPELESNFLNLILDDRSPVSAPETLKSALHNHIITCAVSWFRYWKKNRRRGQAPPTEAEVFESYPYHGTMVHLSRLVDHQEKCMRVVRIVWDEVVEHWEGMDGLPGDGSEIDELWEQQVIRSRRIRTTPTVLNFEELLPFFRLAIEITSKPIRRYDSQSDYPYYLDTNQEPISFYLLNSGSMGMKLYYSNDYHAKVRTKKAAIFIGGDILSRGLTVEGLSVSYFGRSAGSEMGDTVLQRARWFGHKKSFADLVQVYLQKRAQVLFRQIANADRDLRIQIKQSIRRGLTPMQVLLKLRNSPWFAATSSSKSRFLDVDGKVSYSGERAVLREPTFDQDSIKKNHKALVNFQRKHQGLKDISQDPETGLVHNRASLYREVPISEVISFLKSLDCKEDAWRVSPIRYAEFLEEWMDDANVNADLPPINVAVMADRKRKRILSEPKSTNEDQARASITARVGALIGGTSPSGRYKGDYFLDKPVEWHENASKEQTKSKSRRHGDSILIVLYELDPNYVTRQLFNPGQSDDEMGMFEFVDPVFLRPGDTGFVSGGLPTIAFAAFTPVGGPVYNIGVNKLVRGAGLVVDEDRDDEVEEN